MYSQTENVNHSHVIVLCYKQNSLGCDISVFNADKFILCCSARNEQSRHSVKLPSVSVRTILCDGDVLNALPCNTVTVFKQRKLKHDMRNDSKSMKHTALMKKLGSVHEE
jgi:hypothetical protein